MKTPHYLFLTAISFNSCRAQASQNFVDWSQPPVACVEEILPQKPERPCPDLSKLEKPLMDWPTELPEEEVKYWQSSKTWFRYCRGKEVFRRERAQPGSQKANHLELSWMYLQGVENSEVKIKSLYEVSEKQQIPAQVLAGALTQESLFAPLGITSDGENYSCGIGQLNVQEWCRWAEALSSSEKQKLQWPLENVQCSLFPPALIKPFYEIAITRLKGRPHYLLTKKDFAGIKLSQVADKFPQGPNSVQKLRFTAARSFINHCQKADVGISAKAHELRLIFDRYVPAGFKQIQKYSGRDSYRRKCAQTVSQPYFPLHLGWLLAVGIYNSGPRAVDSLAHYFDFTFEDLQTRAVLQNLEVKDLIEAFYWSGSYKTSDDRIHFQLLNGKATSWLWFKTCVLQRHIARVVQHATLPLTPKLADSLENGITCAKSEFDPNNGQLIRSGVPEFRRASSGKKPTKE
jgi:hypothetical protein